MEKKIKDYNDLILQNNQKCNDCGIRNPIYCSVNNGVTLCEKCKEIHNSLFPNSISFILNLHQTKLDETAYKYFLFGGNKNFYQNLKNFEISTKIIIEKKYKCMASEYYRKGLNCKVHNTTLDIENMKIEKAGEIINSENIVPFDNEYPDLVKYLTKKQNFFKKTKNYIINTAIPVKERLLEGKDFAFIRIKRFFRWVFPKQATSQELVRIENDVKNKKVRGESDNNLK